MVRIDIKEGIKQALKKGETLRQAMMSFYVAGYPKEDIETAARAVQVEQLRSKSNMISTKTSKAIPEKKENKKNEGKNKIDTNKKVSKYESPQKPSFFHRKIVLIFLILLLLFLIGTLVTVFVFQVDIVNFLNKSFG